LFKKSLKSAEEKILLLIEKLFWFILNGIIAILFLLAISDNSNWAILAKISM